MKLLSYVGIPQFDYPQEKQEYKAGEKLGGFTFPFNFFGSIDEAFRRFGLWQSSNGINLPGVDHIPFWLGKKMVKNDKPILVGDKINGETVVQSECEFLDRLGLWECYCEFGELPELLASSEEIRLVNTLFENDADIAKELVDMISSLVVQVLPLCVCPPGGNLVTSAAEPIFQALKMNAETKINKILETGEQNKWH
ncbi:MAG: hypothetical protein ACRCVN_05985 [Spirochaetia bacterium]